jgi:cephalosporin hydroxylase
MTNDAQKFLALIDVCDAFAKQHARQVTVAKAAFARIEVLESAVKFGAGVSALPDGPQKVALAVQAEQLASRMTSLDSEHEVSGVLAHLESHQERIEASLKDLRDSFSDDHVAS